MSLPHHPPRVRLAITATACALALSSPRAGAAPHATPARPLHVAAAARTLRAMLARPAPPLTVLPVRARVSSRFGYRRDPITHRRKLHKGIDFAARRGAEVLSAGAGVVITAGRMRGYGRVVIIDHGDGLVTLYAHLRRMTVTRGDVVAPGTIVGKVGASGRATGPHLHFEVRRGGKVIDPRRELPIGGPRRRRHAGS